MTRSIFDPNNPNVEQSGQNRYLGERAEEGSLIPEDLIDGETAADEEPQDAESAAVPEPPVDQRSNPSNSTD